jgi:uncharacterized membrane protein YagU involved in acid resistance
MSGGRSVGRELAIWMLSVGRGGAAGVAATLPMTGAMKLLRRKLPLHERRTLPPRRIAMRLARRVGLLEHMDEQQRDQLTLVAHFGFGAAAGALYSPFARRRPSPLSLVRGMAFGLCVWLVSYLGWLPAVGLFGPATKDTKGNTVLMIAAHVVWGAALGVLVDLFGWANVPWERADRASGSPTVRE